MSPMLLITLVAPLAAGLFLTEWLFAPRPQ